MDKPYVLTLGSHAEWHNLHDMQEAMTDMAALLECLSVGETITIRRAAE